MTQQSLRLDFGMGKEPIKEFVLYEKIIKDRGSKYSVSIGKIKSEEETMLFLKRLKEYKKYAKADHNSWAVRIAHDKALFEGMNDDGEKGAGMVILRILQKEDVVNVIVCVTRWFGGIKLMGDRFKHIQDATKYAIDHI